MKTDYVGANSSDARFKLDANLDELLDIPSNYAKWKKTQPALNMIFAVTINTVCGNNFALAAESMIFKIGISFSFIAMFINSNTVFQGHLLTDAWQTIKKNQRPETEPLIYSLYQPLQSNWTKRTSVKVLPLHSKHTTNSRSRAHIYIQA